MTHPVASKPPVPHRFLHVSFNFRSGPPNVAEFDRLMGFATDWYRYAPNCWIIWTGGNPESWYNFLGPQVSAKDDYLFIAEMNGAYAGWLPAGAWEWLRRIRLEPKA